MRSALYNYFIFILHLFLYIKCVLKVATKSVTLHTYSYEIWPHLGWKPDPLYSQLFLCSCHNSGYADTSCVIITQILIEIIKPEFYERHFRVSLFYSKSEPRWKNQICKYIVTTRNCNWPGFSVSRLKMISIFIYISFYRAGQGVTPISHNI